ncbi:hypothetical protein B0H14DRAFT_2251304, partial [Mycena olivaceomarginata]
EDEKPQPNLGNLATHVRTKHGDDTEIPSSEPGFTCEISEASAKIMEKNYLREGKLNPALNPTQIGFNRVFAAWIIEDDLAFTTGESPGIQRLFDYIGSRFGLPSDTTVRNTLANLDNARTNDVLIRALSDRQGFNIQWAPENSQIRCIAHVVNLVVQKILATLDEAHDPKEQDYYIPNKDLPFHYDPD